MMLPTHVLVGLTVAAPLAIAVPELAPAILTGALGGSILPDLDMYAGHRRTLHYPTLYPVAAGLLGIVAVITLDPWVVALAMGLVGAALHCRMDRYGGGLEFRPWEGTSDRGVYDHVKRRWREPKRFVRYDGAPEDVVVAVALGIPLWFVLTEPYQLLVGAALLVGVTYGLVRRRLPDLALALFALPPARYQRYLPGRYRQ